MLICRVMYPLLFHYINENQFKGQCTVFFVSLTRTNITGIHVISYNLIACRLYEFSQHVQLFYIMVFDPDMLDSLSYHPVSAFHS